MSLLLGKLTYQLQPLDFIACDYIIPVPLHWRRRMYRGYNQADLIAQAYARNKNVRIIHPAKRIKSTAMQSELSANQRMNNLTDAFELGPLWHDCLRDKHLLLVDDVLTTGATVSELARVLYKARPASISVIVAARAV
jgi:ComF family protein